MSSHIVDVDLSIEDKDRDSSKSASSFYAETKYPSWPTVGVFWTWNIIKWILCFRECLHQGHVGSIWWYFIQESLYDA